MTFKITSRLLRVEVVVNQREEQDQTLFMIKFWLCLEFLATQGKRKFGHNPKPNVTWQISL